MRASRMRRPTKKSGLYPDSYYNDRLCGADRRSSPRCSFWEPLPVTMGASRTLPWSRSRPRSMLPTADRAARRAARRALRKRPMPSHRHRAREAAQEDRARRAVRRAARRHRTKDRRRPRLPRLPPVRPLRVIPRKKDRRAATRRRPLLLRPLLLPRRQADRRAVTAEAGRRRTAITSSFPSSAGCCTKSRSDTRGCPSFRD